jgi:hypothetical protein
LWPPRGGGLVDPSYHHQAMFYRGPLKPQFKVFKDI